MSQFFASGGQTIPKTGKSQFSFQPQIKAMPKDVQITTQLHSFHMLAKLCSKSFKLGLNYTWTEKAVYCHLYAEYIMWNAGLDESHAGIKIAGRNINNLRYTDDTTLMAEK